MFVVLGRCAFMTSAPYTSIAVYFREQCCRPPSPAPEGNALPRLSASCIISFSSADELDMLLLKYLAFLA